MISKEEMLMFKKLDELKNIDITKEGRKIMFDPRPYFEKYLKYIDERVIILAKFEIYFKMKSIDNCEGHVEKAKKDFDYFMNKFTISGYLDILYKFYSYALEITEDVLNNGNNSILDLYNENKISKENMENSLKCLKEAEPMMISDKEMLINTLKQVKEESKKIQDVLNPGFEGFSDSPF